MKVAHFGEDVLDILTYEKDGFVFTVYPIFGANARNGIELGIMPALKWESPVSGRVNTVTINAETSTKGLFLVQLEHEWYINANWQTRGDLVFNSREDRYWMPKDSGDFYFERQEFALDWEFLRSFGPFFRAGAAMFMTKNDFRGSVPEYYDGEEITGHNGGRITGIGPKVVFDSRNRSLAPQNGSLMQFSTLFTGAGEAGDYQYSRFFFDSRHYISIKEDETILAFQGIVEYADEEVPFFEAPQLGGEERLRGIGHPLRKSGSAVWLYRGELRQHLWWRFGMAAFAGVGQVSDNFQGPFHSLIASYGGGFRFRILPRDPLNIRLDVGFSSFGTRGFFLSLKEAF